MNVGAGEGNKLFFLFFLFMKKTTLVVWFFVVFGLYVAYERMNPAPAVVVALSGSGNQSVASSASLPAQTSSAGSGTPPASSPAASSAPAAATPTPVAKTQAGQYRNGTYTGQSVNAYYGNVKVQAVVNGGKLANVVFLSYPNTHAASVYINSQAMPYLTQEALQTQSANVDVISGATFTSEAFVQSLASALSQAKNS